MTKRKTFNVEEFKQSINKMLAGSVVDSSNRKTMMVILENVLMETGNYNGYRYLGENEVPQWQLPGINNSVYEKCEKPTVEELFSLTDDTRVCYL